ncbi:hypothetical protein [Wukongibacter sp. M2B1]
MEVLMVIMIIIIYFLLDISEKEADSNTYDFLEQSQELNPPQNL